MRKLLILLICVFLLCPWAASGVEAVQYVAVTFDGCPAGDAGQALLEGLGDRGVRVTFFLRGTSCAQGRQIAGAGHEIGLLAPADLGGLSRRAIAGELANLREQLPERCRVRLLRPEGRCSDGLRQVARAQGMSLLEWSLDPWVTAPGGRSILERVRDGDVILLEGGAVSASLNLIDLLRKHGFTLVTVSELANLREIPLYPGQTYRSFPRESP